MDIIVKKDELANYGNQMLNISNEFNRDIKKFTRIIEEINDAWDGADALKYVNTMKDKYIRNLEDTRKTIENYASFLNKVGDVYQSVDEVFASKNIDV